MRWQPVQMVECFGIAGWIKHVGGGWYDVRSVHEDIGDLGRVKGRSLAVQLCWDYQ
jgi:hypothetical protein